MKTKTCTYPDCENKNPQPIDNFWKETGTPDGRQRWCQDCQRLYRKSPRGQQVQRKYARSEKRKAVLRMYDQSEKGRATRKIIKKRYRQTEKGRQQHRDENKRHRERHPKRDAARTAITKAVDKKEIPVARELSCVHCGDQASEYHHQSYAKEHWFDVIPLCNCCHNLIHNPPQKHS